MTPRHINWDEINDALQGLAQDHGIQLDDNTLDELTHHVATVLGAFTVVDEPRDGARSRVSDGPHPVPIL